MNRRRGLLLIAASIVAVVAASASAPVAAADDANKQQIAYSETYLKYVALFPPGWAPNGCELAVTLSGGPGICEAIFDPVYFYPDGSTGPTPWVIDTSSPTGWSVPNPCDGVPNLDYETWSSFVDATTYPELGIEAPTLTVDQIACGEWTWGWWW